MEQLIFELAAPEPPSFANFLPGPNREAVAALRKFATGDVAETGLVLWGPPGVGKTHLLRAAGGAAEGNRPVRFVAVADDLPDDGPPPKTLVLVDDVDRADAALQARLFTVYNSLKAAGGSLVATASLPPARMAMRDDLRSRLGWGLIHEILPLADEDKPQALAAYAHARGFALTDDVIAYLLAHGRRDMPSLVASLAALDRHSLASKRPITLPMLREWMQRGLRFSAEAPTETPP
ncbi:MAG TPA: DnaA regulatory inactivator Hda [Casimicrobiaceae bacterium]|nr:DnaA regulatory inactivator Hda [Casimicrobiaceae bacterium]